MWGVVKKRRVSEMWGVVKKEVYLKFRALKKGSEMMGL